MCGRRGGGGSPDLIVLFIIHKNEKNYKRMTYTKIKLYIILIFHFFPRINNKKLRKGGARWPYSKFFKK